MLSLTLFKEREGSASVFGGFWFFLLVFYPLEGIFFSSAGLSLLKLKVHFVGHLSSSCLVVLSILHERMFFKGSGFRRVFL